MLNADNPFRRYKLEPQQQVRKQQIGENQTIKTIRGAWKQCGVGSRTGVIRFYQKAYRLLRKIEYTAKDVERFSIVLAELQDDKEFGFRAGIFLSALINNCKEEEFVIFTNHLSKMVNYLGFSNRKNITVQGNVGGLLGNEMRTGKITVNGNARMSVAPFMRGGEIHINGEIDSVSEYIADGIIYQNGKRRPE